MASAESTKLKKHACERCRHSKVRCHLDTLNECGKCRRCFDSDKECRFLDLPPRKPRKRTDARVTTLEKELATMKHIFNQMHANQDIPRRTGSHKRSFVASSTSNSSSGTPDTAALSSYTSLDTSSETISGHLSSTMLAEQDARDLFDDFVRFCLPQLPVVIIDQCFDDLRETRPVLLLAAITAASGARGQLFSRLHQHLTRIISDKVMVNGERSVELLEANLLLEVWFNPPDDLRHLNFDQWVHIATTMAMQLGLVGDLSSEEIKDSVPSGLMQDIDKYRQRRDALAIYFASSSAALSLKRPKILQMNQALSTGLNSLKNSASLWDRRLAAWVELQIIAESACTLTAEISNIVERVRYYDNQLEDWKTSLDSELMIDSLLVHYHFIRTKLHERFMRLGRSSQELVPPYLSNGSGHRGELGSPTSLGESPAIPNADSIGGFSRGCKAILDTVLSISPSQLRYYPTVTFVRAVYAIKGLMMLQSAWDRYEDARRMIGNEELRSATYLDDIQSLLSKTAANDSCKVAAKILDLVKFLANRTNSEKTETSRRYDKPLQGNSIPVSNPSSQGFSAAVHANPTPTDSYFDWPVMPDFEDLSYSGGADFGFDDFGWEFFESTAPPIFIT